MLEKIDFLDEGAQYNKNLKNMKLLEFIIPDEIAYKKINHKTILDKIKELITKKMHSKNYPFNVMLTTLEKREKILIK